MRLMTYNILRGGLDGASNARLERACALIRQVAPDVLVVNECNDFERDGARTLYWLERELGLRGVLAPASSGYHVALFLRRPQLVQTRLLERGLHHSAIAATLEVGGWHCDVVAAHLCPFSGETRVAEAQYLASQLGARPLFLLGDLNALSPSDAPALDTGRWLPRRRVRHELPGSPGVLDTRAIALLEAAGLVDTFRAARAAAPTAQTPLCPGFQDYQLRIDYVLATSDAAERVRRVERIEGALADAASDHYPLAVDVEL